MKSETMANHKYLCVKCFVNLFNLSPYAVFGKKKYFLVERHRYPYLQTHIIYIRSTIVLHAKWNLKASTIHDAFWMVLSEILQCNNITNIFVRLFLALYFT